MRPTMPPAKKGGKMNLRGNGIIAKVVNGRFDSVGPAFGCIYTPDCPSDDPKLQGEKSNAIITIGCIRCNRTLSGENAKGPPFLCNSCRNLWKTDARDIQLSVAYSEDDPKKNLFVVVMNQNDIAGLYAPEYEKVPVHLGFVTESKPHHNKKRQIRFHHQKFVRNILAIFRKKK